MKIKVSRITILLVTTFTAVLLTASHVRAQSTTSINVTEISFSPSTIDTTSGAPTVTMTIHVTDTERDIRVVEVTLRSPLSVHGGYSLIPQDLISGDARDGVYRKTFPYWQHAEAGIWVVDSLYIIDGSDPNYRWRQFDTSYLAARGLLTQLQVINNNEADPPEISDFNFTLSTINGSRNLTVTLRAKDTGSGVSHLDGMFANPGDCAFTYDEPCDQIGFVFTRADRISGDDKDGVYRVSFDISQDIPPGIYSATLRAFDGVDNSTRVRYSTQFLRLSAAPFVGISGRVLTPDGRGLKNAVVSITDSLGIRRNATTTSFGNFTFNDVLSGETYVIAVISKRFRYTSQQMLVNASLTNVDFMGLE